MKVWIVLGLSVLLTLLTACNLTGDDFQFEFETDVQCNESSVDYVEVYAQNIPTDLEKGYIYSNVFSYGQYTFIFHNPNAEREINEYQTIITIGNKFFNDEGVYLKTEIPEGYYLEEVQYKYGAMCRDETDEELIQSNLTTSFVYYSRKDYSETVFTETYSDLFE